MIRDRATRVHHRPLARATSVRRTRLAEKRKRPDEPASGQHAIRLRFGGSNSVGLDGAHLEVLRHDPLAFAIRRAHLEVDPLARTFAVAEHAVGLAELTP